ncbi:MAG TPA: Flp pilus assembly protein CpaB [Solirubrobacteraceae bacterium]
MELTSKKLNVPRVRGLPSSRRGAVALAVGCALAAGIILLIALSQYRQSVSAANKDVSVLVSTGSIQKGTSGDLIAAQRLYKPTPILAKNLSTGALTNAAALSGEVAVQNILPGQQLTAADFAVSTSGVVGQLEPGQRALSVALDSEHGLVGEVEPGDHVDLYGAFSGGGGSGTSGGTVVKLLIPNALVLKVPGSSSGVGGGGQAGTVVLAVNNSQVGTLAFAAEDGKVWLALRPGGASNPSQTLTTYNSVVFGTGGR